MAAVSAAVSTSTVPRQPWGCAGREQAGGVASGYVPRANHTAAGSWPMVVVLSCSPLGCLPRRCSAAHTSRAGHRRGHRAARLVRCIASPRQSTTVSPLVSPPEAASYHGSRAAERSAARVHRALATGSEPLQITGAGRPKAAARSGQPEPSQSHFSTVARLPTRLAAALHLHACRAPQTTPPARISAASLFSRLHRQRVCSVRLGWAFFLARVTVPGRCRRFLLHIPPAPLFGPPTQRASWPSQLVLFCAPARCPLPVGSFPCAVVHDRAECILSDTPPPPACRPLGRPA
ncbi:hypothetical protein T440DRAFT_524028 [Plenodomus tracheiphilus IPT5]|uniref:Uncharacterized protein n=1 Tax=Plenodomus tracheiphilus IPT5 TaxID=1408161 RepID=A0A6A7BLY4_9PLEO|nr:hypothetical protein T440DRAFT_524028 [Plenodomus tracheiphilus IPT5]